MPLEQRELRGRVGAGTRRGLLFRSAARPVAVELFGHLAKEFVTAEEEPGDSLSDCRK